MTKNNLLKIGFVVIVAFLYENAFAQKLETKNYASLPYWITMMRDTNTNYFETVKAFNAFWAGRENPLAEDEKLANAGKEEDKTKSKNIPYSFEYRKFLRWQMQVKPYVQNDGSILYPYQQRQLSINARKGTPINNTK
jgi:hypothetical protein